MADTINMPKLGFDMAEGTLIRWVKQVGETINKGEVLAEIETDKATVEVESSASGIVLQHIVDQGTVVPVNAPIAVIGQAGEKIEREFLADPERTASAESPKSTTPLPAIQNAGPLADLSAMPGSMQAALMDGPSRVKASPLARKFARERRMDLSRIQGTGPGGRIVRKDIEAALAPGGTQSVDRGSQTLVHGLSSTILQTPDDKAVPTTKLRQAIGRRLVESKQTIPHFYVTHEYKMDSLLEIRKQLIEYLPENEKISVNDFLLKATALTLRQFPNLNASIRGNEVIHFGHINIGVAVTVAGGLLTIVVKDADQKSLRQISSEVKAMAGRAREGKVKSEDVEGSTFSTSNLGMYDVEEFIAIINPPEAAILAVGSAREVPVVENGTIKAGWRMKATISVDHRISDGAEAAQFMQGLAGFLENPARLLL
ncbi:MAG: 2-oxo acid dehydrogenase subunit E2 [Chloroflexi bacterium]|nr:2-oxo acid dehydrogenase subunit E2 [Chloroflexota bacterium]